MQTTECGPANHLPYTQRQLKGTWKLEGGADVNSSTILGGLPLLLMVQVRTFAPPSSPPPRTRRARSSAAWPV